MSEITPDVVTHLAHLARIGLTDNEITRLTGEDEENAVWWERLHAMDGTNLVRGATDDAAVLLVDHQSGLCNIVGDFSPDEFKNNVLALADAAKADHDHANSATG